MTLQERLSAEEAVAYLQRLHRGGVGGIRADVLKHASYLLQEVEVGEIQSGFFETERGRVEEYAKRISDGEVCPPLLLFRDRDYRGQLAVLDGEHRLQAALKTKRGTVLAYIAEPNILAVPLTEIHRYDDPSNVWSDTPLEIVKGHWATLEEADAEVIKRWGSGCIGSPDPRARHVFFVQRRI
jgi:hypothetical protein